MNYRILATGVAIAAALVPMRAIAADFSALYVFGDSLSDTGNVFRFTGQPQPPYFAGRLSDGPVWIDYLAEDLNLTPTLLANVLFDGDPFPDGINFAIGGSTTGTENSIVPGFSTGLQAQLSLFAQGLGGDPVDPDALYIVWGGANDYLPVDSGFTPSTTPEPTVDNLVASITALAALGARNFLVPNLPTLGQVPLVAGTPLSPLLNGLSDSHNALLATRLATLETLFPSVNLTLLDVNSLFNQALAGDFGFTTVDTPCLTTVVCSDPQTHLFWDAVHPTTAAHQQIAKLASATLHSGISHPEDPTSVPEPLSVVGLMTVGVLGLRLTQRAS